jgi:hypothetical protein
MFDSEHRPSITVRGGLAETIGHVALNVLTNYFNKAADVEIDFPAVAA